ncbi:hypothetical protein ACTSKR_11440 [Chitinibacteraceae bacterium HSL-7]
MRSGTDMLRDIAHGELVEDLGEAIRTLNHAITMCDDKRGGSITLTLKVKPAGRGSGALNVDYDIKTKAPTLPRRSSIMFGTPEGDMLATDPTQRQLDLRTVDTTPSATLRDVSEVGQQLREA